VLLPKKFYGGNQMLGKTEPQGNFFDSYIRDNFLPKEHELLKIKER